MGTIKNLVAAGLLLVSATVNAAANQIFRNSESLSPNEDNAGADTYKLYSGDGSINDGWPTAENWASFDSMWDANEALMLNGCAWFAQSVAENSPSETEDIKKNILATAQYTQVDPRFILAVTMQESRGCVRVKTTVGSHPNPGLMQSHEGEFSCFNLASGQACSTKTISGMIMDGTSGTAAGDGLAAVLQQQAALGYSGSQLYYRAARVYNSGSVAADGVLEHGVATHCYVSNIANRLTGWAANTRSYCCPWDSSAGSQCDAVPAQGSMPASTLLSATNNNTTKTIHSESTAVSAQPSSSAPSALTSSSMYELATDSAMSTGPCFPAFHTASAVQQISSPLTIYSTSTRSILPWAYWSSSFVTRTSCTKSFNSTSINATSTTTVSLGYGTTKVNASSPTSSSNDTLPVITLTVLPLPLTLNDTTAGQITLSTVPQTTTVNATATSLTTIWRTPPPHFTSATFNASDVIWPTATYSRGPSNSTPGVADASTSSIDWGQLSSLLSPEMSTVTMIVDGCHPTSVS